MRRPEAFQYYWLEPEQIVIGYTNKAACTSIRHALIRCKRYANHEVIERGLRSRLYLRHPLVRLASAWAYFSPANNFPREPVRTNKAYEFLKSHPTIEAFIDAVLDHDNENEHWAPQIEQHRPLEFDEIYRLEDIAATWPSRFKLGHENKSRVEKPEITHRRDELHRYYAEDLHAWLHPTS